MLFITGTRNNEQLQLVFSAKKKKNAAFPFLCSSLFIFRCCVTSARAKCNLRNHPINTHGDKTPHYGVWIHGYQRKKKKHSAEGLQVGRCGAGTSADLTPLRLRGGRPKTRRRTINLVGRRRRARPRLSRGEVRPGCAKQAPRANASAAAPMKRSPY